MASHGTTSRPHTVFAACLLALGLAGCGVNEILRMRELLEKMISEHTGKSLEQVSKDIERDKILTAEGAVEYGLIDQVIESRKGAPALSS